MGSDCKNVPLQGQLESNCLTIWITDVILVFPGRYVRILRMNEVKRYNFNHLGAFCPSPFAARSPAFEGGETSEAQGEPRALWQLIQSAVEGSGRGVERFGPKNMWK
jgi:hypothetical protein